LSANSRQNRFISKQKQIIILSVTISIEGVVLALLELIA
jgi:hypothetical protein